MKPCHARVPCEFKQEKAEAGACSCSCSPGRDETPAPVPSPVLHGRPRTAERAGPAGSVPSAGGQGQLRTPNQVQDHVPRPPRNRLHGAASAPASPLPGTVGLGGLGEAGGGGLGRLLPFGPLQPVVPVMTWNLGQPAPARRPGSSPPPPRRQPPCQDPGHSNFPASGTTAPWGEGPGVGVPGRRAPPSPSCVSRRPGTPSLGMCPLVDVAEGTHQGLAAGE